MVLLQDGVTVVQKAYANAHIAYDIMKRDAIQFVTANYNFALPVLIVIAFVWEKKTLNFCGFL